MSSTMQTGGQGGDSGSDGWDKPSNKLADVWALSMVGRSVSRMSSSLKKTSKHNSNAAGDGDATTCSDSSAKRVQFEQDADKLAQVQFFDNSAALSVPRNTLFVTKEEKIGKLDDLEEVVYEYVNGGQEHLVYIQHLEQLWKQCCSEQQGIANSSGHRKDTHDIALNRARGLELRFLPQAKQHRAEVVQQVLQMQKTLKQVPMMGAANRSKLLGSKYTKLSSRSKLLAQALADGDAQVAEAYQHGRKTLAAQCA